jgi:hypothetical protein
VNAVRTGYGCAQLSQSLIEGASAGGASKKQEVGVCGHDAISRTMLRLD